MMRCILILFAAVIGAAAQPLPNGPPLVDVVVTDADGHPVTDLTPADFEVTAAGQARSVESLTVFDALRHTAVTRGALPALDLTPDQIHRTIVIIVDDLCMSPDALSQARTQLRRVTEQLNDADRVAILRTSGGTARERQLTANSQELASQIDAIEYTGAAAASSCANAVWTTVTYALSGLRQEQGRKAIVVVSGDLPGPAGGPGSQMIQLAARAAGAVYQTASMAPAFAAGTGGAAGVPLERAFAEQGAYYVLALAAGSGDRDLSVKVRREGLTVRARHIIMGRPPDFSFGAPRLPDDLTQEALNSPFEGTGIAMHLTTMYTNDAKTGPYVQTLCYVDPRDLSWLRDSKGIYHAEIDLNLAGVLQPGQQAMGISRTHKFDLSEEQHQATLRQGLVLTFAMGTAAPGPRQIRAVVTEGRSNRMGATSTFVDVPDLAKHALAISGIVLRASEGGDRGSPAMREFRAGDRLEFGYDVFNVSANSEGQSQLETQIRLFSGGREVFTGPVSKVSYPRAADPARRGINGKLILSSNWPPGRYVMHVTVTDVLLPQPISASQWMDFTIAK